MYNDGTTDVYSYNNKSQLTTLTEPFATIAYQYDIAAGRQESPRPQPTTSAATR